jgi:hypothetical protein
VKAFCMRWEHSLSRMWRVGANALSRSLRCNSVQAVVISMAWFVFRALNRIALLSYSYKIKIYWYPQDDWVGKRPVWSEYDF